MSTKKLSSVVLSATAITCLFAGSALAANGPLTAASATTPPSTSAPHSVAAGTVTEAEREVYGDTLVGFEDGLPVFSDLTEQAPAGIDEDDNSPTITKRLPSGELVDEEGTVLEEPGVQRGDKNAEDILTHSAKFDNCHDPQKVGSVTRADIIRRANSWVDAKMPYGQSSWACEKKYRKKKNGKKNHTFKPGNWDFIQYGNYRRDCSGLVSMSGGIGGPNGGYWTGAMLDNAGGKLKSIKRSELRRGDILVKKGHVVLFYGWTKSGRAKIIHTNNWGKVARYDSYSAKYAKKFKAKRFKHLKEAAKPAVPAKSNVSYGDQTLFTLNQEHVFHVTSTGNLRHAFYDQKAKKLATHVMGKHGAYTGKPVAAVFGGNQHVVVRKKAKNGQSELEHLWIDPRTGKTHRQSGKIGHAIGNAELAVVDGKMYVFWVDKSGSLQQRVMSSNGKFSAAKKLSTGGEKVQGSPSFMFTHNQRHVFVRGKENSLRHVWLNIDSGKYYTDQWMPPGTVFGDPDSGTYNNKHEQHVFFQGKNNSLEHVSWWPGADRLKKEIWAWNMVGKPSFFNYDNFQVHATYRTTTGRVVSAWWDKNTGKVHSQERFGVNTTTNDPVTLLTPGLQHVFVQGSHNKLNHWVFNTAPGNEPFRDVW